MTFDEVKQRIDQLQGEAGYATHGDVDRPIYSGLEMHNILNELDDALDDLRDEYVPEIEMTQSQKNSFDEAKRALHTRDLSSNFCQEWTVLDEVSGNIFGHGPGEATDEQINMIMRAWLHPELVKVVD